MNHEEPIRDQVEKLRKRIDTVVAKEQEKEAEDLPQRSRSHHQKRSKTKVKIKYPLLKILGLFFILLPIVVFSVYTYNQSIDKAVQTTTERVDYETVQIHDSSEDTGDEETEDQKQNTANTETEVKPPSEETSTPAVTETLPQTGGEATAEQAVTPSETPANTQTTPEEASKQEVIQHTVQPSETLYRIAMKYYKSQDGVAIITQANHIKNNEIKVGQVLLIPLSK